MWKLLQVLWRRFQSTLPRGERRDRQYIRCKGHFISIHAPARGATEGTYLTAAEQNISIHAPARGATTALKSSPILSLFQSTLPRGERLPIIGHIDDVMAISIHAPARGATASNQEDWRTKYISIHAPARGATSFALCPRQPTKISIHAPARGATGCTGCSLRPYPHFNPRSREGSD